MICDLRMVNSELHASPYFLLSSASCFLPSAFLLVTCHSSLVTAFPFRRR